jgi:tetratricopeptide (TPR) repeat protein
VDARSTFEAMGDDHGVALALFAVAHVNHNAMQWQKRHEALELALQLVSPVDDPYLHDQLSLWMAAGFVYGPMTVDDGLRWFETNSARGTQAPWLFDMRAQLESMLGRIERARELADIASRRFGELGQELWLASRGMLRSLIEMRAGDDEAAAREAVSGAESLQAIGERGWLSTCAGYAAQSLLRVDRDSEAEHWIGVAEEVGGEDDVVTQAIIRQVRGLLASREGRHADAERLVLDAAALVEVTDALEQRAQVQVDLAEVLRAAGRDKEAEMALERAVAFYDQKGHVVGAARTRALLATTAS